MTIRNDSTELPFPQVYQILDKALPDYFVRQGGTLNPARVMGLLVRMCTMGQKGYRRVIREVKDGLWHAFGWIGEDEVPTAQAFGQARRALTPTVCLQAFDAVYAACATARCGAYARYAGRRVIAVDGTRLRLPESKELGDAFGRPYNGTDAVSVPCAGLVQLWDVGAQQPVAFSLTRTDFSERDEALDLLRHLSDQDILVGDRGYPSWRFFAALHERDIAYIIRCSTRHNKVVRTFMASDAVDAVVSFPQSQKNTDPQRPVPALTVRLVKIQLPDGRTEVLATSLPHDEHPAEDIAGIYRARWRIETAFREMKVWHALEDFSALFPAGIEQEVMAIQIFMLIASELEAKAHVYHHEQTKDEPEPDANTEQDSSIQRIATGHGIAFNRLLIADAAVSLTFHAIGDWDSLPQRIQMNLKEIWRNRSKRKPNRSNPRKQKLRRGR